MNFFMLRGGEDYTAEDRECSVMTPVVKKRGGIAVLGPAATRLSLSVASSTATESS